MNLIVVCVVLLLACTLAAAGAAAAPAAKKVDFRYSLPWWQTSVCLPDDPDKPLVGKEGQYFFDYGGKGPRKFAFSIAPQIEGSAKWLRQETASAKAPVVRTWWEAGGLELLSEAFLIVPDKGAQESAPRRHAVILHLKNPGPRAQSCRPVVRIEGTEPVSLRQEPGIVAIGGATRLLASAEIEACEQQGKQYLVKLRPVEVPAGETREVAFTILRHGAQQDRALSAADALRERDRAIQWWESADLPWDAIQVPDPAIQGMLQSCVRNIWQAREIKNGQPAFQVGPTCYRGLWIVDGAFLLESAALLGRAKEARAGVHYNLSFQKPDGSFEVIGRYWKENGIVLWTCCRHAVLTQDQAWLESIWPKLEKVVAAIQRLRERSRAESPELDDGLMPTGFPDGGIGGNIPEYSNVYWNLLGLKAIIGAAEWLGKKDQAALWRKEYDGFMAAFRKTAARDMATDPFGNRYLPTVMGDAGKKHLPQRGQWAFLHAVHPGQVFAKDDPLVQGNLAMLRATKQQGLVFGTGWDAQGIWTYAASFYGHAVLWQGEGQEAAQVLYDYANHAAPVRVWREEQRPAGKGAHEVGDMPHNWASAEFIRLTAHLLELDRGDELHLFEGLPREWAQAGMRTRLNAVATPFGPLTLQLEIAADGKAARLGIGPLDAARCKRVVVHAGAWSGREAEELIELEPGKGTQRSIELR